MQGNVVLRVPPVSDLRQNGEPWKRTHVKNEHVSLLPLDVGLRLLNDLVCNLEVGNVDRGSVAVVRDWMIPSIVAEVRRLQGAMVLCAESRQLERTIMSR